jgi:hypothetical protein
MAYQLSTFTTGDLRLILGFVHTHCSVYRLFSKLGSSCHQTEWQVTRGSRILLKYSHSLAESPNTFIRISHIGRNLKIPWKLVEVGLLHSQAFTNNNFHFLMLWTLLLPNVICRFSKISSFTRATFTPVLDVPRRPVASPTWLSVRPFANFLHHFLTRCTGITSSPYTPTSEQWIAMKATCLGHERRRRVLTPSRGTQHPCVHCTPTYPLRAGPSIHVSTAHQLIPWTAPDCHAIRCVLPPLQVLPLLWPVKITALVSGSW